MNRILLTTFLIACCSVANAQWEHLAELRVPVIYPMPPYGQTCFGKSVWGYNFDSGFKFFLSMDQGQSFKPFPLSGLPGTITLYESQPFMFADYYLTLQGNQLYRMLPNSETWEPLGTPIDTTPDYSFRFVARQGEKFIVSGTTYVVDTTTWEWTEIYKEFRSIDEGNTWSPNETGLPGFGFSWSTVLDSVVLAQNGAKDSTYFSTDGGANWQAVIYPPGICQALNIRNRTGSNLLAQDTCQQLYFSADGGKSWVLTNGLGSLPFSTYNGLFYGQLLQSGGSLIIRSWGDSLYRSNDEGATWSSIPINLYSSVGDGYAEFIVTPNGTLLVFTQPELYASTDAGDTWINALDAPDVDAEVCDGCYTLASTDSLVYLMGAGGFFVSTDQGLTWTDRTQNAPHIVSAIEGLSANGPLLVAQKAFGFCNTYISPDSGVTWNKSPACCVKFARNTPQGIFVCTHGNVFHDGGGPYSLFKSTDEGVNWKGVPLESEGWLDFLQPAGEKLLVMGPAIQVADPARLMVSATQGESWALSSNGIDPGTNLSCAAYDSVTGKIYTTTRIQNPDYPGGIYVSSDQGQTWEISAPDLRGASMVADNGNVCVMGIDQVHVSYDSGATWATIADPVLAGNWDAENALVLADGNLVMGGNSVFISRDWGETWTTFNEGLPPGASAADLVRDDQYLYIASRKLGIFRRPISDLTTGTRPEASAEMALEVFPNPSANGLFNVKTGSAGERPVQLFVMDASGKTIWRGVLSGGRQTVNLSAAPPGVYWLRAVSDKETAVRKLVKTGI